MSNVEIDNNFNIRHSLFDILRFYNPLDHPQIMGSKSDMTNIHNNILKLDAHLDIEVTFITPERPGVLGFDKLVTWEQMIQGDLNGAFFAIYSEQPKAGKEDYEQAKKDCLEKFRLIHEAVDSHDDLVLVTKACDVNKYYQQGKRVAMIGMENGYPIGLDLKNLEEYYNLGCRYLTLSHCGHNQICDSGVSLDLNENIHNGLSDFGKDVVRGMNQMGMIVDVAHVHKKTVMDVAKITKAPIIVSHAACSGVFVHERNVDDETLLAIKETGGVVCVVGLSYFIKDIQPEKLQLIYQLRKDMGLPKEHWEFLFDFMSQPDSVQAEYKLREAKFNTQYPSASVTDYVDHIDHAVSIMGVDHVGISSDFFDESHCLVGWENAGKCESITQELIKRSYTKEEIEKLWSGNLLRVWKDVQDKR